MRILKEKAMYGCWLDTGDTLLGLLWNVVTEYRHDRRLVG